MANGAKVNQSTHYHSQLYSGTGTSAYHLDCQSDGNIVRYKNDGTGTIGMLDAIKNITRSGTTFTATKLNGGTFTFTQQDNNTTYTALPGTTTTNGNHLIPCKYVAKLSEPNQISGNYRGFIQFGEIGGSLLTKWSGKDNPGDYSGIVIVGQDAFKEMFVVSPRSNYCWLVRM